MGRIVSIDLVIRGHNGLYATPFDHRFKGGKVDFPQRALVHHRVYGLPAVLLAVCSEVLDAGRRRR